MNAAPCRAEAHEPDKPLELIGLCVQKSENANTRNINKYSLCKIPIILN